MSAPLALGAPATVHAVTEPAQLIRLHREPGDRWTTPGLEVRWTAAAAADITILAPEFALSWIVLRWPHTFPDDTLFLGDAWERSYGDLQWRHRQPDRVMPWYFLAHRPATSATWGLGVKTQPNVFCFWMVDDTGVALWLDARNGGGPVRLGDRELSAATVVAETFTDVDAFSAAQQFCRRLSPAPLRSAHPICGNNNWYYAYGENFDANAIRRDARFLAEISDGHPHRPYSVIDAGWTAGGVCAGGPWDQSDATRFPDMAGLAGDISDMGVQPGLWIRLSALSAGQSHRGHLRAGPQPAPETAIDLTHAGNLATIAQDVARVRQWGYRLLKHDFSTYDSFGRFGFDMKAELTVPGWHWEDRTRTNAEVLLHFYRLIREQAGDMVLIGCNTVGHLAAGLVELQRVGDDTSGKHWERTRRMGINALAFRLPQHNTFFAIDADCAAHTPHTPWEKDRQFLDLVARSGTALFVSTDPTRVSEEQMRDYRAAMSLALSGGETGGVLPTDWLQTVTPRRWRSGSEIRIYDWTEAAGIWPFNC